MHMNSDTHAVHLAIYRWKPNAPITEIEDSLNDLRAISKDIPAIQFLTWGRNTSRYSEGFSHAITIVANDAVAIEQYRQHPLHRPVTQLLDVWEETGIGVDFENKNS